MAESKRITKRAIDACEAAKSSPSFLWDGELRGFGVKSNPSGSKIFILQYRNGERKLRRIEIGRFGVMTLEQAREQISEHVFTDKRKAEFQKYLQKLRAQAIIEWKNDDVKRAFEEGMKLQAAAPSL